MVVFVYGGPHVQLVTKAGHGWRDSGFFLRFLVQQGILVFTLDNRGSANRGRAFEQSIYANMSRLEVSDQRDGVNFLRTDARVNSFVDGDNIGIYRQRERLQRFVQ